MSFIESPRFPDEISQGSRGSSAYSTDIVTAASGYEARNSNWTESRRSYDASFAVIDETTLALLLEYFHAMKGKANTFRFKDWGDFKSVNADQTITSSDQDLGAGDGTTRAFQLIKKYTQGLTSQRDIKKPVAGTVIASVGGFDDDRFAVATATGIITFDADNQKTITGATAANPVEITVTGPHALTTGKTAYISGLTGDWAALNGSRYVITSTGTSTFTIDVNTSAFTAYSSNGGQSNTLPQAGETVAAGYEFDVPCRFDTDILTRTFENYMTGSIDVPIIEIRI